MQIMQLQKAAGIVVTNLSQLLQFSYEKDFLQKFKKNNLDTWNRLVIWQSEYEKQNVTDLQQEIKKSNFDKSYEFIIKNQQNFRDKVLSERIEISKIFSKFFLFLAFHPIEQYNSNNEKKRMDASILLGFILNPSTKVNNVIEMALFREKKKIVFSFPKSTEKLEFTLQQMENELCSNAGISPRVKTLCKIIGCEQDKNFWKNFFIYQYTPQAVNFKEFFFAFHFLHLVAFQFDYMKKNLLHKLPKEEKTVEKISFLDKSEFSENDDENDEDDNYEMIFSSEGEEENSQEQINSKTKIESEKKMDSTPTQVIDITNDITNTKDWDDIMNQLGKGQSRKPKQYSAKKTISKKKKAVKIVKLDAELFSKSVKLSQEIYKKQQELNQLMKQKNDIDQKLQKTTAIK